MLLTKGLRSPRAKQARENTAIKEKQASSETEKGTQDPGCESQQSLPRAVGERLSLLQYLEFHCILVIPSMVSHWSPSSKAREQGHVVRDLTCFPESVC